MNLNFTNNKSVEELWKEEKKHKPKLILLAILMIFILLISSALLISTSIFLTVEDQTFYNYEQNILLFSLLSMFIASFSFYSYISSIKKSYDNKNLAFISQRSYSLLFLLSFIFPIYLISYFVNNDFLKNKSLFKTVEVILPFILTLILVLITWITLFIFMNIRKIQKDFLIAHHTEQAKKVLENLPELNNIFDKFSSFENTDDLNKQKQKTSEDKQSKEENKFSKEKEELKEKLQKLEIEKLRNIASKLEISGIENMSKEELIQIIVRLS
ncbi:hypothetical protein [Mesomycoplasma molare]|uniref:Rho termination factor N-terminal domain-containing protein n=1 Tax=Mesomycoplasma molare TaxID=171288 RepID=A0ABY5TWR1_9BACT|nr:hypothetical protein [Mesomycoplasma molare]UWD33966.1 hypothetical protein NX772_02560 [Mesomycoplasma molare]